jgi:hypothetical protein
LLPVGLILLAAGLILHNWISGARAEFPAGFLIGMSIVFMVAGFLKRSRFTR